MGPVQSSMMNLVGTGAAAILATKKLLDKDEGSGIDEAMAAKARKTAQAKIKAIQANKDISEKARTRRIGKVLDEYQTTIGGKK